MARYSLSLEDFGDPARGRPSQVERAHAAEIARVRGEAQAAGYAEGFAAALAEAETEERAAIADLRERLADAAIGLADARAAAVAALGPVLAAIIRVAAPQAAAAGLADAVVSAVSERLSATPAGPLVVRAAPAHADTLEAALAAAGLGAAAAVRPDPTLDGARACVDWAGGGAVCDPEACLAAALDTIARHFAPPEERTRDAG
ncbi:MAG: hypothetical protein EA355_10620 [Rhodobacteraceae bacterium]|nr:MAG: hypothetical protein EA355_10620 [Paracoccaceae bacterium]